MIDFYQMSRLNFARGLNSDARRHNRVNISNPDSDDRRVNVSHVLTAVGCIISINMNFFERSVGNKMQEWYRRLLLYIVAQNFKSIV